jgi:triphosphoribosyl-dephospho-CoA synthase
MTPTIGQIAERACLLEAQARKPGNVHPGASFADLTYEDFVASAAAIRPVFDRAPTRGVGATVLDAIVATRRSVKTNTNLGIILLLAPLARVGGAIRLTTPGEREALRSAIQGVLEETTVTDAEQVYEAIRLSRAGGLGEVEEGDVRSRPTGTLLEMMVLARDRDLIARQYAGAFFEVIHEGFPALERALKSGAALHDGIVTCFLELLSRHPDSLIARKCGGEVASEASRRAREVLDAGWPRTEVGATALRDLDRWLRDDDHRRNPGATADVTAGVLFLAMRGGIIPVGDGSESSAPVDARDR